MIGLSGQLGNGVLGAFELGTMLTGGTFIPHRGRVHSGLSAATVRSALTPNRVRSILSAAKTKSEVTSE